jgi:hypothetical protein
MVGSEKQWSFRAAAQIVRASGDWRGGRLANYKLMFEHTVRRPNRRTSTLSAQLRQQHFESRASHCCDWLPNGGELRPYGGCLGGVVEAHDAKVLRQVQAAAMGDTDDGGCHVVVAGENCRRRLGKIKKTLGRVQSRAKGKLALLQMNVFLVESGLTYGIVKALEALRACDLIRVTLYHRNASVTKADQVFGHLSGSGAIVNSNV